MMTTLVRFSIASNAPQEAILRAFVVIASLLITLSGSVSGAKRPPNVLFISIDDLNDWTGCLGGHPQAKTPNIDRLANQGTLFENAHCQAPVCNPSRASLLTGRYPHSTGVYFLSPDLKKSPVLKGATTLPEAFAAAGYTTLAAGKIFHGGDKRFFQSYAGSFGGFGPRPDEKISQPHGHPLWDWGAYPDSDEEMPDSRISEWAEGQLKRDFEKPFFLAVGFYRPHVPMFVPQRWFDQHPRENIQLPRVRADDRLDLSDYAIHLTNLKHVSPEHAWVQQSGQWEHAVQAYLASTTFVDACVGRVLNALQHSKHADNTIVVLFSDHGFHLGEKQRWAKRTLWEDGTRVPLIVAAPPSLNVGQAGQRCRRPAGLIDIYPTLIELAGLPQNENLEGKSLVPLLRDPDREWNNPALTSFGKGNYAVRSTQYRYIRYVDGSEELYDHATDPHEWKNLASKKALSAVIQDHRQWLPRNAQPVLPGKSTGHAAYQATHERLGLSP